MALSHDDVREILRIIDESDLDELRVETEGFSLHVSERGGAGPQPRTLRRSAAGRPSAAAPRSGRQRHRRTSCSTCRRRCSARSTAPSRPGAAPFVEVGAGSSPTRSCASSR